MTVRVLDGNCRDVLATLDAESVQCCVTSPPYWGLRDYGVAGQLGLERTPDEYVARMVEVFAAVRRVLRDDGTLWLNLGDSYGGQKGGDTRSGFNERYHGKRYATDKQGETPTQLPERELIAGTRAKDLVGIPWRTALALQSDGWYLRSDIIWAKPNPMPESVTDRPTKAHEYLFLLAKSERYFYDVDAIKEEASYGSHGGSEANPGWKATETGSHSGSLGLTPKQRESKKRGEFNGKTNALPGREAFRAITETRNRRSVWTIATTPYSGAHFATFPPKLIEPCILAGTKRGDVVLDPFGGAGTTGLVADRLGRDAVLIELNPEYAKLARERITSDAPLFGDVA